MLSKYPDLQLYASIIIYSNGFNFNIEFCVDVAKVVHFLYFSFDVLFVDFNVDVDADDIYCLLLIL